MKEKDAPPKPAAVVLQIKLQALLFFVYLHSRPGGGNSTIKVVAFTVTHSPEQLVVCMLR